VGDLAVLPGCGVVILTARIPEAVASGYAVASPDLHFVAVDDTYRLTAYSDVGVTAPAFDSGHRRDPTFGLRLSEPDRRVQEPSIKLLNEDSTFQRC
jgi:hypothetical protein